MSTDPAVEAARRAGAEDGWPVAWTLAVDAAREALAPLRVLVEALDALPPLPPEYDAVSARAVDRLVEALKRRIYTSEELT